MSFANYQNFPSKINGEEIISIVQGKKHFNSATFQGMLDRNEYLYTEEQNRYHLGLLSTWGMQSTESYPIISKLLEKGAELTVNGYFGEFTYDKPFYDPKKGMRTIASTVAEAGDYPGIDESEFDLLLSEKCYPGEVLGVDPYGDELQLGVVSCEASELNGQGWRTTVTVTSGQASDYYNPSFLEAEVNYYKINATVGVEYTTQFAGVEMPSGGPSGMLRARFKLGGIRGVEGYATAFADAIEGGLATATYDDETQRAMAQMQASKYAKGDRNADTVIFGERGEENLPNLRATSLMEYLVEKTLAKRTATSHLWQKIGQFKNTNGAITYLNEGVWHQMRRGKIITFPKFGGITKAHIAEAVDYIYRGNPELDWREREVVFEGGKLAEDNLLLIFQNEVMQQIAALQQAGALQFLFGDRGVLSDTLRTKLIKGDNLNNLEMVDMLRFTSVVLPGIAGKVSIRHNPSLDRLSGNPTDFKGQFKNGYDWTSHSLIIWDVTDQSYSNNEKNIQGAKTLNGDTRITENLYLVRPEAGMMVKGQENGRWDRGKTAGIISSSSRLGMGFWAFNSSAMWIPNPEKVVMIELSKGARRLGSVPYNY